MAKQFDELKPETQAILTEIKAVKFGQVASYRDIAYRAGLINGARQVSRALHGLSNAHELPWWRIIRSDGKIGLTGAMKQQQIELLRAENIEVTDAGKVLVDKEKYEN